MDTTTLSPLRKEDREAISPEGDEQILATALARFRHASDSELEEREQQLHAMRFRAGEHSPPVRHGTGEAYPPPLLTVDRQRQHLNQIVNSYRKNPLSIRIRPKSVGATKQVAELLEGHVRSVEQESEAAIAYTTALDNAASIGTGYFRLVIDYPDPWAFDQTVKIEPLYNRFAVFMDPDARHPAALDANWCFVTSMLSRDAFMAEYDTQPPSVAEWVALGNDREWYTGDEVQVADYYYRTWERTELVRMPDGTVLPTEGLDDLDPAWPKRVTRIPQVWWVQLCGTAILAKERWKGAYIPVIRVEGDRLVVDGQMQRTGITQASMTPALAYDYFFSSQTEAIALAPKAPWLVYAEQIAGYEQYWNRANDAYQPYLLHKAVSVNGQLLPPPQRATVEPAIQAINAALATADEAIRASLGMYAPSVGQPQGDQSGVAIRTEKITGDQATYNYPDNLSWSIRACGIQLVDLLRKLHAGPTELRQIAPDGNVSMAKVNQTYQDDDGVEQQHMLGQGQFDVVIDSGPAYSTQREMSVEKLGILATAQPDLVPFFADYWAGNMDVAHSEQISARLKTAVPPQALAATEDKDPETRVAQLQTQLQQLGTQFQALQEQMQQDKATQEAAVQQVKLLEQQVATSQARLADKQQENQLDAQKNQQDHDFNMARLRLEEQKLMLEMAQMQQQAVSVNGQEGL
jgi:Phage P22-like portal protein